MNISIHYKREQKEILPCSFTSDSGDRGEREVDFRDVVKAFNIPHIKLDTVTEEYPDAQMEEIDEDAEDRTAVIVLEMQRNGVFSCKHGKAYKLFPGTRVPIDHNALAVSQRSNFDDGDIEMAAILSDAVYHSDPVDYINKNYLFSKSVSTLVGVKFAYHASYPYLLAITRIETNKETMWVAFRGTTNWEDMLTNLTFIPTLGEAGLVHRGFWERASKFPHNRFATECYRTQNFQRRLIFTGHSLGGSVAHLSALKHLVGKSDNEEPQVFSITFGAPFFGNRTVAEDFLKRNLNQRFLTIVNHGDCVPNILNIVESAIQCMSTMQPIAKLCTSIIEMLSSLFNSSSARTESKGEEIIAKLNNVVLELKTVLKDLRLEYEPIGTYGFIHVHASKSGNEQCQWVTEYLNNQFKTESNKDLFIDSISKKLRNLYGSRSQKYTDESIVSHRMHKYIEALKSCRIIERHNGNMRQVTELGQFDPKVALASAVCRNSDMKITLTGDNLDFISLHKPDCLRSSVQLFKRGSITIPSEQTKQSVTLTNSMLIPTEKLIKAGPQQWFLQTHFGEIQFDLVWDENMSIHSTQQGMFSKFDMNFLTAAFLRAVFAYVHSNKKLTVQRNN